MPVFLVGTIINRAMSAFGALWLVGTIIIHAIFVLVQMRMRMARLRYRFKRASLILRFGWVWFNQQSSH